jgi:hypothetical protein
MNNMSTAYRNLPGNISIREFRMLIGTPVLSTDKTQISIPFTGIANPTLTADLSVFEYSMDNGSNWNTMTTSSTTTGLSFTSSGAAFTLVWEARSDAAALMFNTYIRIRLRAESGSYETAYATYIIFFEKITTNTQLQTSPLFPPDYRGIPGTDLMANAPR